MASFTAQFESEIGCESQCVYALTLTACSTLTTTSSEVSDELDIDDLLLPDIYEVEPEETSRHPACAVLPSCFDASDLKFVSTSIASSSFSRTIDGVPSEGGRKRQRGYRDGIEDLRPSKVPRTQKPSIHATDPPLAPSNIKKCRWHSGDDICGMEGTSRDVWEHIKHKHGLVWKAKVRPLPQISKCGWRGCLTTGTTTELCKH